jgi:hypothetical protein
VLRWWPAWTRPKTARELPAPSALSLSLTRSLTGGSRPSAPSPTSRRDFGELKHAIGELSASAVRRASFPNLPRTQRHPFHPLSPILALVTTGTADGRLGRANAGHYEQVERELSSAKASEAHHDFNRAKSSSGEARSDAGHGGVLAAALWPELETGKARVGATVG